MSASKLKVQWKGNIVLGGPANAEEQARQELEELLYGFLSECYYLDDSMRAAKYAEVIASKVPYQIKGKEIITFVNIDVLYRNPPGPFKWWIRVRTDNNGVISNTVKPGTRS